MKGFTKVFRTGHVVAPAHAHRKRSAPCSSGGFYKTPTAGQVIPYTTPLNISWDTSCMTSNTVDIYLYAPGSALPRIHEWANVDFAYGSYNVNLMPKWWNSTASANLQLAIVEAGTPPFLATMPAGPVFTATYTKPTSGSVPAAADTSTPGASIQNVNNGPSKSHGLSKGAVAAAVLLPLLFVIGLAVGVYIKLSRAKGRDKRKRWNEAIDKRMSTISTSWRPVSVAGATVVVRNSVLSSAANAGDRASSFSFGAMRPSSTIAVEGGQAGIGAKGLEIGGIDLSSPDMAHIRPGVRARASSFGSERVSRVSFAPDTRPSGEYRRTRAFHVGHVPPLPDEDETGALSPTQAAGPFSLSAEDIQARMSGQEDSRPSIDAVLPALSMMRTGGDGVSNNDDMLLAPSPPMPAPPSLAHQIPKSSIVGIMPMQPMPANVMSPDEMLRAYAERRTIGSPVPGGPTVPAPVANYNGTGMRILYSPTTPDSSAPLATSPMAPASPESQYTISSPKAIQELVRKSIAVTVASQYEDLDDEDAYGAVETGMAE
ncbi:hypothetical protein BKA93DRAFT_149947 [Sparassis latifolia]